MYVSFEPSGKILEVSNDPILNETKIRGFNKVDTFLEWERNLKKDENGLPIKPIHPISHTTCFSEQETKLLRELLTEYKLEEIYFNQQIGLTVDDNEKLLREKSELINELFTYIVNWEIQFYDNISRAESDSYCSKGIEYDLWKNGRSDEIVILKLEATMRGYEFDFFMKNIVAPKIINFRIVVSALVAAKANTEREINGIENMNELNSFKGLLRTKFFNSLSNNVTFATEKMKC